MLKKARLYSSICVPWRASRCLTHHSSCAQAILFQRPRQRGKELQQQKEAAEGKKNSLAGQLNQVISDMREAEKS